MSDSADDLADPEVGPYLDGLKSGLWRLPLCSTCGRHFFYPRSLCPHCQSFDWTWDEPLVEAGTVVSSTTIHRGLAPHFPALLHLALIEVIADVVVVGRLDTDLPPGARVEPVWDGLNDGIPAFVGGDRP